MYLFNTKFSFPLYISYISNEPISHCSSHGYPPSLYHSTTTNKIYSVGSWKIINILNHTRGREKESGEEGGGRENEKAKTKMAKIRKRRNKNKKDNTERNEIDDKSE